MLYVKDAILCQEPGLVLKITGRNAQNETRHQQWKVLPLSLLFGDLFRSEKKRLE